MAYDPNDTVARQAIQPYHGIKKNDGQRLYLAPLVALVAYFVRGVAGFCSALVASHLLAQFFPLTRVVVVVQLQLHRPGLAAQAGDRLARPLPFSFVGIAAALHLHNLLDSDRLKLALGLSAMSFAFCLRR